jgi:hypothetical protein
MAKGFHFYDTLGALRKVIGAHFYDSAGTRHEIVGGYFYDTLGQLRQFYAKDVPRYVNFDFVAGQMPGAVGVQPPNYGSIVGGFLPLAPFTATGARAGLFNLFTDGSTLRLNYFTDDEPGLGQAAFGALDIPGFGSFPTATAAYHYDTLGKFADWQWTLATNFSVGQTYQVRITVQPVFVGATSPVVSGAAQDGSTSGLVGRVSIPYSFGVSGAWITDVVIDPAGGTATLVVYVKSPWPSPQFSGLTLNGVAMTGPTNTSSSGNYQRYTFTGPVTPPAVGSTIAISVTHQ